MCACYPCNLRSHKRFIRWHQSDTNDSNPKIKELHAKLLQSGGFVMFRFQFETDVYWNRNDFWKSEQGVILWQVVKWCITPWSEIMCCLWCANMNRYPLLHLEIFFFASTLRADRFKEKAKKIGVCGPSCLCAFASYISTAVDIGTIAMSMLLFHVSFPVA